MNVIETLAAHWESFMECIPYTFYLLATKDALSKEIGHDIELSVESRTSSFISTLK